MHDAIAHRAGLDTVAGMSPQELGPAGLAYQELLTAILTGPEDERPLLLLMATTLARPWELLDPATRIAGGCVHIAASTFNNVTTPARVVPLPRPIVESLAGKEGTTFDVLDEDPRRRGQLLELARVALSELDLSSPVDLEELLLVHLAALAEEATTTEQVESAARTAGLLSSTRRQDRTTTSTTSAGGHRPTATATRHLALARRAFSN